MRVLVTGASGFVGRAMVARLAAESRYSVRAAWRGNPVDVPGVESVSLGDLGERRNWSDALRGCDAVVHLAARVHMMRDVATDPLAEYRRVNVDGTLALATQAAAAGVRRFIFLSSIKVNGELTLPGRAFAASDDPAPQDPYGVSKYEAEHQLQRLAAASDMEVVRIRPPLVYGPGVGANFLSMMRWVRRGIPLPLGAVNNRRSFIALANLVDLLVVCLEHAQAANRLFLVADSEDMSTAELLRRIGAEIGTPARLIPVPPYLIRAAATLVGKPGLARRLCDSLRIDAQPTRATLGWQPPLTSEQGLRLVVRDFLDQSARAARSASNSRK